MLPVLLLAVAAALAGAQTVSVVDLRPFYANNSSPVLLATLAAAGFVVRTNRSAACSARSAAMRALTDHFAVS